MICEKENCADCEKVGNCSEGYEKTMQWRAKMERKLEIEKKCIDWKKEAEILKLKYSLEDKYAQLFGWLSATAILSVKNVPRTKEWHNTWFEELTGQSPEEYNGYSERECKSRFDTYSYASKITFLDPGPEFDDEELMRLIGEIKEQHKIVRSKDGWITISVNNLYRLMIDCGFTLYNEGLHHNIDLIKENLIPQEHYPIFDEWYLMGLEAKDAYTSG